MRTFWRLLGFLRPYRSGVIWSIVLATGAMALTVAIPWLTGRAIDQVNGGDRPELLMLGLAIVGVGVFRAGLTVFRRLVAGRVSLDIEVDLRDRLYRQFQALELSWFDRQQTGQLMSRATVDLQSVRFFLGYGLIWFAQSVLALVLSAIAMFLIDPALAAISLAPIPFVAFVAWRYGRRARPAIQETQQRIAELTADVEENVGGVRVIKAFAREDRQLRRFGASVGRVFDQAMVATRLEARYAPLMGFLPQLGLAAILLYGGHRVIVGDLTIGQFTAFYTYLLMLLAPTRWFGIVLSMASARPHRRLACSRSTTASPSSSLRPTRRRFPAGAGHVELRGVSLDYAPGQAGSREVLRDIDLDIPAGSTVALVGATGSGKTSLIALISRLYDVTTGSVRVDGADVRDVDVASLRHQIAIVDDDPFLFSATVAENIAYAAAGAPQDAIELAARRAQAHDFIAELPEGYETRVGERGMTLSGGQRQRIAIARALLANPRILILDDATSSVDAATERAIKAALRESAQGRTTFVIAHRLSTISLADTIVVLEDGSVAAQGDHETLLGRSELYREIVERGLPEQAIVDETFEQREVAGL